MKRAKKLVAVILMAAMLLTGCPTSNKSQAAAADAGQKQSDTENSKLKLVFTIDVEVGYDLIECDFGEAGNCGVNYLMDTFEEYGMRAVFFVDVYEHLIFVGEHENYMEGLVKRISQRGHEVGLHTHANRSLDFYNHDLFTYNYEQQSEIIQYGMDFIKENTGKYPISFRGGAYRVNDDTFKVLADKGFKYDSSYYYGIEGNRFEKYNSLNAVCKASDAAADLIEFPVIRTINSKGSISKLDLNSMTLEEMIYVLEEMKEREDFPAAQIMLHSFSLADQKGKPGETPVFVRGSHNLYGVSEELQKRFTDLLEYVKNDSDIEVVTFEEYDKLNLDLPQNNIGDGIFACDSEKARNALQTFVFDPQYNVDSKRIKLNFAPKDVSISQNGNEVTFKNNYEPDLMEYAWYILDYDTQEPIDKIMYNQAGRTLVYTFHNDGRFRVKAYVRVKDDPKSILSKIIADVSVDNGNITVEPLRAIDEPVTEWEKQIEAEIIDNSTKAYEKLIDGIGKDGNPITIPYDWSCAKYLDTDTSFCYHMHGFLFLDASYVIYVNSGDTAYKDLIMNFIVDWVNSNPSIDFDNKWAWHDDATARRVLRMSWYFSQWEQDFSKEDGQKIRESLMEQAELLAQKSFYKKNHNHGMYQDLGLAAYALLLAEEPLRQQYLDLAAKRSREYFAFCFTEDGVHTEHSPAYQQHVAIELLRFSVLFSESDPEYAQWLADLYGRTGVFMAEIVQPDNSWPSTGDSSRKYSPLGSLAYDDPEFDYVASNGEIGVQPPADVVFPKGGYAVMRSSWEDLPEEATYLLFMASTHSTAHKHGDDLSFILYHRGDLFVEAGNRDYNYSHEMTTYSYSGYAHNVLCVDDQAFPVTVSASGWQRVNNAAFDTKIVSYDMESPIKTASAIQTRFENVEQVRTVSYDKENGVVTITDDLDVKEASKCTLLYHLAAGIEVQESDDGWTLSRDGVAVAQVTVSSSLSPKPELSAVTGGDEGEAPYHTWIFDGKKEPRIGSLLKVDNQCPACAVQIVTTIVLL